MFKKILLLGILILVLSSSVFGETVKVIEYTDDSSEASTLTGSAGYRIQSITPNATIDLTIMTLNLAGSSGSAGDVKICIYGDDLSDECTTREFTTSELPTWPTPSKYNFTFAGTSKLTSGHTYNITAHANDATATIYWSATAGVAVLGYTAYSSDNSSWVSNTRTQGLIVYGTPYVETSGNFSLTARNEQLVSIQTFNISISNSTDTLYYTTTDGSILTNISNLSNNLWDLTVWSENNYFPISYEDYNVSSNLEVILYDTNFNLTPSSGDYVNIDPSFSFIYENSNDTSMDCTLYDNRTGTWAARDTLSTSTGSNNVSQSFGTTSLSDGTIIWNVHCDDGTRTYTSLSNHTLTLDTINPIITINYPSADNSTELQDDLNLDIMVNDTNNYYAIITVWDSDSNEVFQQEYNTTGITLYNITDTVTNGVVGNHTLYIETADGHTKKEINNFNNKIENKEIEFNDISTIKIYPKDKELFDDVSIKKEKDRYSFDFKKDKTIQDKNNFNSKNKKDYDEFIVESDADIDIIEDSEFAGHLIIKEGSIYDWKWIDFETVDNFNVDVIRQNKNKVIIRVYGGVNDYSFNSIGKLNVANKTVLYYFDNSTATLTESYTPQVISGFETDYELNVTYNPLAYHSSGFPILGYNLSNIQIDNINYTPTTVSNNNGSLVFNYSNTFTVLSETNITHKWFVNLRIKDCFGDCVEEFNTSNANQTIYTLRFGECNSTHPYNVSTFYYRDELDNNLITTDMGYNLHFYDGTYVYDTTGSFTNNTNDTICVNINPLDFEYNFNLYGDITLSKDNYITRIIAIDGSVPYLVSNIYPGVSINLYMITISNSTSINYNWLTTNYQLVDGTMLIYSCNINGTKNLIESTPITSGNAVANLKLLTQSYSYNVIVDEVLYTDESYSTCHIENTNELTYYVDTNPVDLSPLIGFNGILCSMTKVNDSTAKMTWESNDYSTSSIQGCILGYRSDITGNVLVYSNCTNSSSYTMTRSVEDNGFPYTVRGLITQDGYSAYCSPDLSFYKDNTVAGILGSVGLIMALIIIMGLVLFYAGDGEGMLIGGIIGVVVVFIMGVTVLDWLMASSLIGFLLIIMIIGRYSRK